MSDKTLVERLREGNNANATCAGAVIGALLNRDHTANCLGTECQNCINEMIKKLADTIEREYLPRPRFENGELVNIGDQFEFDGESFHIRDLHVGLDEKTYIVARERDGLFDMEPGERVKRPAPEVLDADGVPIKVGDVVWFVGGAEYFDVLGTESNGDVHIGRDDGTSTDAWAVPSDLTHKQPDSLERIEEDALMASTDYCDKYGLLDSGCNAEEGDDAVRHCTDCGLTCEKRMINHLLRRQREVLERGHER